MFCDSKQLQWSHHKKQDFPWFGPCDTRCINMVFTLKWLEIQLTGQSAQIKYLLKKENKQNSPGIDAKTSLTYWFFFSSNFEVCDKTLFLKNPIFFFQIRKRKTNGERTYRKLVVLTEREHLKSKPFLWHFKKSNVFFDLKSRRRKRAEERKKEQRDELEGKRRKLGKAEILQLGLPMIGRLGKFL